MLILESDGRRWHARVADFDRDAWRDMQAAVLGYRVLRWSYPMLRRFVPGMVITSRDLANAMLAVALDGTLAGPVIENRDILALARKVPAPTAAGGVDLRT